MSTSGDYKDRRPKIGYRRQEDDPEPIFNPSGEIDFYHLSLLFHAQFLQILVQTCTESPT
jgi:hypothetical protein